MKLSELHRKLDTIHNDMDFPDPEVVVTLDHHDEKILDVAQNGPMIELWTAMALPVDRQADLFVAASPFAQIYRYLPEKGD